MYGQSFDVPDDPDFTLPIGKAKVMREGTDVTIVAFSRMVGHALGVAAEKLAEARHFRRKSSICARLRPLDTETIVASVQENQSSCFG